MKTKLFFLSIFALNFIVLGSINAQQNNTLTILKTDHDTVMRARYFVVGAAQPGAEISVNGNNVKQNRVGSFGYELQLIPGNNIVEVKSIYNGAETNKKYAVFYKAGNPVKAELNSAEVKNKPACSENCMQTPLVVATKPGAYLNYGAGQDRLGGAKINFLAEGIKMEVIDSVDALYKVRLSERNYAFIPKTCVDKTSYGTKVPFSLTGSWSVSNAGETDRVAISLDNPQPYIVKQERDPNRIVIDIYGAACNSNWVSQYFGMKMIDYVDLQQIQPDVFRVMIYLKHKYSWGYTVEYSGNNLIINVKHGVKPTFKAMVIGIDAGHGGSASGAVSISGFKEKEQNLAMAYMLKKELEKRGAKVVLSRTDDSDVSMSDRLSVFKKENIDLLVSIHCNAGGNPLAQGGSSTYYRHIEYRDLAASVLKRVLELKGVRNAGLVGNFNFSLCAPTMFPSVLVETLFLSSVPDEELITDKGFQEKMMKKVAKGLQDYLKLVKHGI